MKYLFIFLFIFLFSIHSKAENLKYEKLLNLNNIEIFIDNSNKIEKEVINKLNDELKFYYKIVDLSYINKVNITINTHSDKDVSFSNLNDNNYCNIGINFKDILDNKNRKIKNLYEELIFNILHEIGHCHLGRESLVNKINWIIPLKEFEKNELNKLIFIQSKNSIELNCSNCKNSNFVFKTIPLNIIYHEMYADTFALILMNHLHKNIVNDIFNLRKNNSLENNLNFYPTHYSISYLKSNYFSNININKKLMIYSQLGLIDYISKINEK